MSHYGPPPFQQHGQHGPPYQQAQHGQYGQYQQQPGPYGQPPARSFGQGGQGSAAAPPYQQQQQHQQQSRDQYHGPTSAGGGGYVYRTPAQPAKPLPQGESHWKAHTTPDGKTYYYHSITRETVWEKPDELKTPFERAIDSCPWKEYTDKESGKKYYYNAVTRTTTWEMPQEIKDIHAEFNVQAPGQESAAPAQSAPAAAAAASQSAAAPSAAADAAAAGARPEAPATGANGAPIAPVEAPVVLDFKTKAEAEQAFTKMLEKVGVEFSWDWERVIRATCLNPYYRSLKTLGERREAFENWRRDGVQREAEAKKLKREQDFAALRELYKSRPEIKATTGYATLKKLLAGDAVFEDALPDHRRAVWVEHTDELRKADQEAEREQRKANKAQMTSLFQSLPITHTTTWREAYVLIMDHPTVQASELLRRADPADILSAFEEVVTVLDMAARQARNARIRAMFRQERIERDGLRAMFRELRDRGLVHARTKWSEVYGIVKNDERFVKGLCQLGSTPLELFWDMVCELEDAFRADKRIVGDWLKEHGIDVTTESTFEVFKTVGKKAFASVNPINLHLIFDEYFERAVLKKKEEQRHHERKIRARMDVFRSMLKRVSNPSIKAEDTWETVRARITTRPEFDSLDETQRREAFDKFIARLKEKMEAGAADDGEVDGAIEEGEEVDDTDERKRRKSSSSKHETSRDSKRSRRHRSRSRSLSSDRSDRDRRRSSGSKRKDVTESDTSETDYDRKKSSSSSSHRRDKRHKRIEVEPKRRDYSSEEEGELRQ